MKNNLATLALLGLVTTLGIAAPAIASPRDKGMGWMEQRNRAYLIDRGLRTEANSARDRKDTRRDKCLCCEMSDCAISANDERVIDQWGDRGMGAVAERGLTRKSYSRRDRKDKRELAMRSHPKERGPDWVVIT